MSYTGLVRGMASLTSPGKVTLGLCVKEPPPHGGLSGTPLPTPHTPPCTLRLPWLFASKLKLLNLSSFKVWYTNGWCGINTETINIPHVPLGSRDSAMFSAWEQCWWVASLPRHFVESMLMVGLPTISGHLKGTGCGSYLAPLAPPGPAQHVYNVPVRRLWTEL